MNENLNVSLSRTLFNVNKKTAKDMITYSLNKDFESLSETYHNYRVFLRFLFIRGELNFTHDELFNYCKNKMARLYDSLT